MTVVQTYHLPGLEPEQIAGWHTLERDGLSLRFPVLNQQVMEQLATGLREAKARVLAGRSAHSIASAIAAAARSFRSGADRGELDRDVAIMSGYSRAMVEHVLDRMEQDWHESVLLRLLDAELDGGHALESFRVQPGRSVRSRAYGPDLTLHIFAGNVPGVAVTALVRSLLVKSAVLGKMGSGEPIVAARFAQVLARIDADLGSCVGVTYWPGEEGGVTERALANADAVVVYGGANAARAIREKAPARVRVIEHGPRFSIGLVGRSVLAGGPGTDRLAMDVARAVATFDQQGCVSPHGVWVEEGGVASGRDFAAAVAESLAALEAELPAGGRSAAESIAIHDARSRAEFRQMAGEETAFWASRDTAWTVIWDRAPDFQPVPLARTLRIHSVQSLLDVPARLAPLGSALQTVAIAADGPTTEVLAQRFAGIGATRITDFARMPWPPADGHHDGRGPLVELVRWVDLEQD